MNANLIKKVDKVLEKLGEVIKVERPSNYAIQHIIPAEYYQ
jgi:hypothetical protein